MLNGICARVAAWVRARLRLPEPPPRVSLRTERLLLRELLDEDLPSLLVFLEDPHVLRYLQRTEPLTQDEVWRELCAARCHQWQEPRHRYDLGIVIPDGDQLIGECGLELLFPHETSREPSGATIWFLLRRDQWGNGYATETARAVVGLAFVELGLPCVFGGCHPENVASRRVLEHLGMTFQGAQADFPGSPEDVEALVYCLDREQWLAQTGPGYDLMLGCSAANG